MLVSLTRLPDEDVPAGILMTLACEKGQDGSFDCISDKEFCVKLARLAPQWEMSVLTIGPVRHLHLFDIMSAEKVDIQALRSKLQEENNAKKALDALKRLTKRPGDADKKRKSTSTSGKGRNRSNTSRRNSKGSGKGNDGSASDDDLVLDAGGSSQSASGTGSESDAGITHEAMPVSARSGSSSSVAVPGAAVPAVERPLADVESLPAEGVASPPASNPPARRRNIRRGHVWGTRPAFQIAPIHAQGSLEPTGWGAICGVHWDPGKPSLQCKKAMSKSGLTDQECQLRLKRWLATGLDTADWGPNHRETHVSLGGVQLAQFSEGLSEAELDELVSHQE